MYPNAALTQAESIARDARAGAARSEQLEHAIEEAEHSTIPVVQSLLLAYRMLQAPMR